MKRRIVRRSSWPSVSSEDEIDLVAVASVDVSSEKQLFPIDNVFDAQRGPGGSCWVASEAGPQTVLVAFDAPQDLRSVSIEVEERANTSTQHVDVSTSRDAGETYDELLVRDFTFSPYGVTFGEETRTVDIRRVTHVRLRITPGPDAIRGRGGDTRASLTAVVFR
jgi:hypothetical protein